MKNAKFLKASFACLLGMSALSLVGANIIKKDVVSAPVEAANSYDSYYADVDTSTPAKLISSLHDIISSPFKSLGYNGLWTAYATTDKKPGTTNALFDWYSKTTNFTIGGSAQGANYKKEGDGYNREHSIPKSWWGDGTSNQGCDVIIVVPTDGYVNNRRSNYPFGETNGETYQSNNNYCRLGTSKLSGYNDTVFEPGDDLKGDFARIYFYAICRWNAQNFTSAEGSSTFAGNLNAPGYGLTSYAKDLFVKWHDEDPVDDWERARNDNVQAVQLNRNPFVDHPEWVDKIWGGTTPGVKTVTSIALSGSLTKSTYAVGEAFDPTGLTVTATYDDNTTGDVTSSVTWNPSTIAAGTTSVTGTYQGKTVTVNGITVKTLSSLSVSGTPTKTTYTAGQSFDPTGLTVTATYSDTSSEVVTSSVTWTPTKLVEGTTSVTGSYGGKTVTVNGLTVEAAPAVEGYTLFEDDIEEGDYVIADQTNALAAENNGSRIKAETISVNSDKVTDPSDTVIWHIEEDEDGYYTVYNTKNSVYAASNGAKNQGTVTGTLDDKALWTISQNSGKFEFVNKYNKASSINANLRFNNAGPYFGTYGTNTGHPLTLYKGGSGSTPTDKVLDHIGISGQLTTLNENSAFSFGGTVTAYYTDNTSSVVTANASFSGYDMTTAGTQTVTVSYGGKSVTYTLTVVATSENHGTTLADPLSVSEARALIDADAAGSITYYVKGVVKKVAYAWKAGNGYSTFMIDETATNTDVDFEFYKGECEQEVGELIAVGDTLIAHGRLSKYGETYEFAAGNVLDTRISLAEKVLAFATEFNDAHVCGTNNTTNAIESVWNEMASAFAACDMYVKDYYKNANASSETVTAVKECLVRYDRVTSLYASFVNFMNRTVVSNSNVIKSVSASNTAVIIITLSSCTLAGLALLILRKKKQFR